VDRVEGSFQVSEPEVGFDLTRPRYRRPECATQSAVASEPEIDALLETIRAAKNKDYQWVTSPFFLDLTLRKPIVESSALDVA
jgi:hypothetical protein